MLTKFCLQNFNIFRQAFKAFKAFFKPSKFCIQNFNIFLQPSALQKEHPALKNMHFFYYFPFFVDLFACRDPDPDSDTDPVSESRFLTHRPSGIRLRNVVFYIERPLRFSKETSHISFKFINF